MYTVYKLLQDDVKMLIYIIYIFLSFCTFKLSRLSCFWLKLHLSALYLELKFFVFQANRVIKAQGLSLTLG